MNRDIFTSALILCLAVPGLLLINYFWGKADRIEHIQNQRFSRKYFVELLPDSAGFPKAELYAFNVWATWCGPCVDEMPALDHLRQKYSGPNVAFVSLTHEDSAKTAAFFKKEPNRFLYHHCLKAMASIRYLEGLNPDSSLKFSQEGTIPVNIITYQDKIVYYHIGADEENIHRMDSVLQKYTGLR